MRKQKVAQSLLQVSAIRVTRVHFLFILIFALQIIIFDSWNLIPHEAVSQRWTAIAVIASLNTVLWFFAKINFDRPIYYIGVIMSLVFADIVLAGFSVYWERGMASTSVVLFVLALLSASVIRSRTIVLATAALCSVGYSTAAVRYFNSNYGEGFRVQLWGQVGFYSALFFIFSLIIIVSLNLSNES